MGRIRLLGLVALLNTTAACTRPDGSPTSDAPRFDAVDVCEVTARQFCEWHDRCGGVEVDACEDLPAACDEFGFRPTLCLSAVALDCYSHPLMGVATCDADASLILISRWEYAIAECQLSDFIRLGRHDAGFSLGFEEADCSVQ